MRTSLIAGLGALLVLAPLAALAGARKDARQVELAESRCAALRPSEVLPEAEHKIVQAEAEARVATLGSGAASATSDRAVTYESLLVTTDQLYTRWLLHALCVDREMGRLSPEAYDAERRRLTGPSLDAGTNISGPALDESAAAAGAVVTPPPPVEPTRHSPPPAGAVVTEEVHVEPGWGRPSLTGPEGAYLEWIPENGSAISNPIRLSDTPVPLFNGAFWLYVEDRSAWRRTVEPLVLDVRQAVDGTIVCDDAACTVALASGSPLELQLVPRSEPGAALFTSVENVFLEDPAGRRFLPYTRIPPGSYALYWGEPQTKLRAMVGHVEVRVGYEYRLRMGDDGRLKWSESGA